MNPLLPGAPARAALDKLQGQIEAIATQERQIAKLPPSEAETRASFHALVQEAVGTAVEPRLSTVRHTPIPTSLEPLNNLQALLIHAVGEDRIVETLMEVHRARNGDRAFGMPAADKAKKLCELAAKREALEVREEELILDLEAQGHFVIRRQAFDPRLVLRVWNRVFG